MNRPTMQRTASAALLSLLLALPAMAQTGGVYDLSWNTFDDGGYMFSAGGDFSLGGTIGQPDASVVVMTGGSFTLTGGFWPGATTSACNTPRLDADGDGDVDLKDFMDFQACFNGPNQPPSSGGDPQKCACLDADGDADVDLKDFMDFQNCFNGPNQPPRCP